MDEPQQTGRTRQREGLTGIRLVGLFVPWQAVVATLVIVAALGGLVAGRWGNGARGEIHLAASGDVSTSTTAEPSTSTTAEASTSTTAPATSTTNTQPAASETAPPTTVKPSTTTTTVAPPATCAVIPAQVTGTVTSSWAATATAGVWERRTSATVTNPTPLPVTLGYISTNNSVSSYLYTLVETDGRVLRPGESVTVEDTFTYAGDHTDYAYSPPPNRLFSVEFSPVSAPRLFCRVDLNRPESQATQRHPTQPNIWVNTSDTNLPTSGPFRLVFSTAGSFPGVRVHYRLLMADGTLGLFIAPEMSPNFVGVSEAEADHNLSDLSAGTQPPRFQGITGVEWNGTLRACADLVTTGCAPADGSLLQTMR